MRLARVIWRWYSRDWYGIRRHWHQRGYSVVWEKSGVRVGSFYATKQQARAECARRNWK